ncbi:MAG: hypothetical protein K0R05_4411 [Anaerocolumna sp.]|nr:hypothetical protein [Anaerocolumna sp.]
MENIRLILFAVGIIINMSCFIDNGRETEIEEWNICQYVKPQTSGEFQNGEYRLRLSRRMRE